MFALTGCTVTAHVLSAHVLLAGPLRLSLDMEAVCRGKPGKTETAIFMHYIGQIIIKHTLLACTLGKSLRTHLEDLADEGLCLLKTMSSEVIDR